MTTTPSPTPPQTPVTWNAPLQWPLPGFGARAYNPPAAAAEPDTPRCVSAPPLAGSSGPAPQPLFLTYCSNSS